MGKLFFLWLVAQATGRGNASPPTPSGGGAAQLPTGGGPPAPKPQQPKTPWQAPMDQAERPPGNPLDRKCSEYDATYWPTAASVKQRFGELGYVVPADRETMNELGPDGKIGGGDDSRSIVVADFQNRYNLASGKNMLGPEAGGLEVDGFVGGCTLNAIQNVYRWFSPDEWLQAVEVA